MQTPSPLILLGWSVRTKLYPPISRRPSGVKESKYVSDKHKNRVCTLKYMVSAVEVLRSYEQIDY